MAADTEAAPDPAPPPPVPAVDSPSAAGPAPPPPAPRQHAVWPNRMATGARISYEWVTTPRVRLWLVGLVLLFVGGLLMSNSVWTLPLVIAGALVVVTAWVGHRLDGRLSLQWGEAGAQLDLRATVRAAPTAGPAGRGVERAAPAAEGAAPVTPAIAGAPEGGGRASRPVIDGEAHTVQIDVSELKALIAAAEASPDTAASPGAAARDMTVTRIVH